jgi:hypothetical protein
VRSFRRRPIVRVNPPANALKRRDGVMNAGARRVQRVYLLLLLLHTLAVSFIWGINTLFLLDAGLTNTQALPRTHSSPPGSSSSRCQRESSPTCAAGGSRTCSAR